MKPTNENRTDLKKAVLSLLWSHCGGIIVALIFCVGMSPLMFGNGLWISTPIVLLVYSLPVYRTMWEIGHADLNRANFGHITLNRWRGIQIGLLAMIPFFLTGVFFLLSKAGLFPNFVVLYKFLNAELWPVINLIQISMYLPDYNWLQTIAVALLIHLIPVAVAEFAYQLGSRDFSIKQKLVYKGKKEGPKPRS